MGSETDKVKLISLQKHQPCLAPRDCLIITTDSVQPLFYSPIPLLLGTALFYAEHPLPLHPLIDHQSYATVELHYGPGRDGFDLGHIHVKAVM